MNFLILLTIVCCIRYSTACNGYSIKLLKYQNCIEDSIIKLPEKNLTMVLDKDCNIYSSGCIELVKGFKTAKAKYVAKKPPLPVIEGELDFCKINEMLQAKSPELAAGLKMMGIPTTCPVEATKFCSGPENKFNITKYKNHIGMAAGTSELRVEIEHDTGKSCFEIQSSISKARKGRT
ncbi:uncharacterized protein [Euwallacea fornicatus]|uniref:uncharacterized protein n=1 Tax=Euwallacea fornicatus TaxID=995702 RepID=UPI00338ED544